MRGAIISITKFGLTIMIMFTVTWVAYITGFYDAPDFEAVTLPGLLDLYGRLLRTDYSYYGYDELGFLGVIGAVLKVAVEVCGRMCGDVFPLR